MIAQVFWFFREPEPLKWISEKTNEQLKPSKPSISVIFVDSVSRTLAFRSWPKTTNLLREMQSSGKRKILDFKLFQSIASSTYWHLYNIFDGPKATLEDNDDIFYFKKSHNFFRKFKKDGYLTSYTWDICYNHTWRGTHLGQWGQWRKFKAATAEMDNMGFGDIACELLLLSTGGYSSFGRKQKCINGHQLVGKGCAISVFH